MSNKRFEVDWLGQGPSLKTGTREKKKRGGEDPSKSMGGGGGPSSRRVVRKDAGESRHKGTPIKPKLFRAEER